MLRIYSHYRDTLSEEEISQLHDTNEVFLTDFLYLQVDDKEDLPAEVIITISTQECTSPPVIVRQIFRNTYLLKLMQLTQLQTTQYVLTLTYDDVMLTRKIYISNPLEVKFEKIIVNAAKSYFQMKLTSKVEAQVL